MDKILTTKPKLLRNKLSNLRNQLRTTIPTEEREPPPTPLRMSARSRETEELRRLNPRRRVFLKNPTQRTDNLDPSTMELSRRTDSEREVPETSEPSRTSSPETLMETRRTLMVRLMRRLLSRSQPTRPSRSTTRRSELTSKTLKPRSRRRSEP